MGDSDDSDKESEEEERARRELYEAIGYAEGEVYEFPREVHIRRYGGSWKHTCTVCMYVRKISHTQDFIQNFSQRGTCSSIPKLGGLGAWSLLKLAVFGGGGEGEGTSRGDISPPTRLNKSLMCGSIDCIGGVVSLTLHIINYIHACRHYSVSN